MSIPHFKHESHIINNFHSVGIEYHRWENDLFIIELAGSKKTKYYSNFFKITLQYILNQNGRGEIFKPKNEYERDLFRLSLKAYNIVKWDYLDVYINETQMQQLYLIHLIYLKTQELSEEVIKLIKSNDLKKIQSAYLLTYPNKGEIKIIKSKNPKNIELAYLLTYQNKES